MRTKPALELVDAMSILTACNAAAQDAGVRVAIAVVDEAGVLLSFQRQDGAKAHTVDLALRKARTAAGLGISTSVLEKMAQEGRLQNTEVLAIGGGVPVIHDGEAAGAVGVSGSSSEIDERIATAGQAACAGRTSA